MRASKISDKEEISLCSTYYNFFRVDVDALIDSGVIKRIAFDQYEWTKSETSLAEYFNWIGKDSTIVEGGFWAPVAKVFKKSRKILSSLASRFTSENYRRRRLGLAPKESRDFKVIRNLVLQHREKIRRQEEEANQLRLKQAKPGEDFQS